MGSRQLVKALGLLLPSSSLFRDFRDSHSFVFKNRYLQNNKRLLEEVDRGGWCVTSEMADRQFWGVVNHQSGSDARLQSEPMPTIGRNPKRTIGQNLIDL
jgi:hypothetical protein